MSQQPHAAAKLQEQFRKSRVPGGTLRVIKKKRFLVEGKVLVGQDPPVGFFIGFLIGFFLSMSSAIHNSFCCKAPHISAELRTLTNTITQRQHPSPFPS